MRRLPVFVLLLVTLTACGQTLESAGGPTCPNSALMEGFTLDVPPEAAAGVTRASMELCWAGNCTTRDVELLPATRSEGQGCTSGDPDGVCSAQAVPTGGKYGYVPIPDLPVTPVKTTVTFDDGKPHVLDVTPVLTYPGDKACGGETPTAKLVVAPGGEVRQQA